MTREDNNIHNPLEVTEDEKIWIKGVVFIKDKKTGMIGPTFEYPTWIDPEKYYFLDQDNMVWEDWSEK